MKDTRTHRGFLVERNSATPGYLSNDMFDKMRDHLRNHTNAEADFGFVTDVTRQAKSLLFRNQGSENLLRMQLWHPSSRWVLSFVSSTLDFVGGKARSIQVENYIDLLEFHPTNMTQFDASNNAGKLREWAELFKLTPEEFISLWMSQPSGLTDMVQSLYLIGGALPSEWMQHPRPLG